MSHVASRQGLQSVTEDARIHACLQALLGLTKFNLSYQLAVIVLMFFLFLLLIGGPGLLVRPRYFPMTVE